MTVRELPIRLLLAENRSDCRKNITRAIKSESGILIEDVAVSGYEAITKALRLSPRVVLINYEMETSMAGVFACKEICAANPDIIVILYGEKPSDDIVCKAFQMGAVNFLRGNFPETELVNAVLTACAGKASIHHSTSALMRGEFKKFMDLQDNMVYVLNVIIKLTPAEFNILRLLYGGIHQSEAAKILFIGMSTMKTHISHILKKFNLENMNQVIASLKSTELFNLIKIPQDYNRMD